MVYQNIVCYGDSQTFGARTYGNYPLYLAKILSEETEYAWRTINRSVNGYTARDLWFKINDEIDGIQDTVQVCLMIGTNDCKTISPDMGQLFKEYLRQILRSFFIKGYTVFFAGIPPIYSKGQIPWTKRSERKRFVLNQIIKDITSEPSPFLHYVDMESLREEHYADAVHFNEKGNEKVAKLFANHILKV